MERLRRIGTLVFFTVVNILLIQLKRIGDLILTTPAIAALRERFPEATLSLVVSPAVEGLLPAIAGIDKVFVVRGKADDALDWIALAWGKFDYCLDFTRNDRSSFLTLLSQATKAHHLGPPEPSHEDSGPQLQRVRGISGAPLAHR